MDRAVGKDPMYRYLLVLTVASAIGLQGWRTLFNNFAVEIAGLNGSQVGIIQSVREIPGFLALLVVYVLLVMREHRLSAVSILCLGVGVGITGLMPTMGGIVVTTLIMSFGFHYYETTNQSLTLQYFDKATAPIVFGRQRSYAAATNIAVGLAIYGMAFLAALYGHVPPDGGLALCHGCLGVCTRSGPSQPAGSAQTDGPAKTILAVLPVDLSVRGAPADFYCVCRFSDGEAIRVFGSGNYAAVCCQ
jgi:hypothetical protein